MSCPVKSPPCPDLTCEKQFSEKQCKCITTKGDSCQPTKTVCAYEDRGIYYGCSSGCCEGQCEGQCSSIYDPLNKTWQKVSTGSPDIVLGKAASTIDLLTIYAISVGILLITLILISTLSLFN